MCCVRAGKELCRIWTGDEGPEGDQERDVQREGGGEVSNLVSCGNAIRANGGPGDDADGHPMGQKLDHGKPRHGR